MDQADLLLSPAAASPAAVDDARRPPPPPAHDSRSTATAPPAVEVLRVASAVVADTPAAQMKVSHGLQLQPLWIIPTAAVS